MKRRTYVIIAFVLVASISLITAVTSQGQQRLVESGPRYGPVDESHDRDPVTPAQVIRMVQAHVPESLIVKLIRSRAARPLSVEELVDLCRMGVSPEVISAMQESRPMEDVLEAALSTLGGVAVSASAIQTAMDGYNVQRMRLDFIADNLANVSTIGFKRWSLNSGDSRGMQTDFRHGIFDTTNNNLDLAIAGNGFFQLREPETGEIVYTRAGNFSRNKDGNIVQSTAETGRLLVPVISLPLDSISVEISPQGIMAVRTSGNPNELTQVGQIYLAKFVNPNGLLKRSENLFSSTEASGDPIISPPGTNGLGMLWNGALERSNVQVNREVWDLQMTLRLLKAQTILLRAAGIDTLGVNIPLGPRPATR